MARPPKEINWDLIKRKMEAGCTAKEIFNEHDTKMCPNVFYERFKEEFGCSFQDYRDCSSEMGKGDIKLMLHAKALNGAINALLFLAERRCGMKVPEVVVAEANNQELIDLKHENMILKNRLTEVESNADKSEAG